jgi:vacuole morphology and inheritance protein 14
VADVGQLAQAQAQPRTRTTNPDLNLTPRPGPPPEMAPVSRPHSPVSFSSQSGVNGNLVNSMPAEEGDPFDYQSTVNELTIQFLSEFEETRVAALKWLIMLHQKAPKKVCDFFLVVLTSHV